jgi:acyl dehydratase
MAEIKTMKREQVFFEDVKVGSEIPPITKKYNLMKMALFASVHGDWCPGHYDHRSGMKAFNRSAPVAYGMQITTHCGQVLTDWISPNGALKKYRSRTTAPTFPYDTLTIRGKVTKKYVEKGENYVECDVWAEKQDGTVVGKAFGTVTLPSRGTPSS